MKTIVLATDGSPSAERAAEFAVGLARDTSARLCIAAVWQAPTANYYGYVAFEEIPELEKAEKLRAHGAARVARELAEAEGVDVETFVREGDTVDVISQTATDCGASIVVVGSHGWGPLRRLVFGSVSTGLLHHAPCPVVVVRTDPERSTRTSARKERALA
jgi:nucleotide-binding universal stress UspA family protein